MYVYAACASCAFSRSSSSSARRPGFLPLSYGTSDSPPVPTTSTIPYDSLPPCWVFSNVVLLRCFRHPSYDTRKVYMYIYTSICARIVFLSFLTQQIFPPACSSVRTWTKVFLMTRGETPSNTLWLGRIVRRFGHDMQLSKQFQGTGTKISKSESTTFMVNVNHGRALVMGS